MSAATAADFALRPGKYILDRDGSGLRQDVKQPVPFEVQDSAWTRMDGVSESDCPASGIYGLDRVVCRGAPPGLGAYECVKILAPDTGAVIARGQCAMASAEFTVALPPGRYIVELSGGRRQDVELIAGHWSRVGIMEAPPCSPHR